MILLIATLDNILLQDFLPCIGLGLISTMKYESSPITLYLRIPMQLLAIAFSSSFYGLVDRRIDGNAARFSQPRISRQK